MLCFGWNFIKTCSQFQKISLLLATPPEVFVLPKNTADHIVAVAFMVILGVNASNYFFFTSSGVVMLEHLHNEIYHFIMILFFFPFFVTIGALRPFKLCMWVGYIFSKFHFRIAKKALQRICFKEGTSS